MNRFGAACTYVSGVSAVVLLLLGAAGCVANISREDLFTQIQGGAPPLVIDVRTPHEFGKDHVPGSVNISVFDFRSRFERLDPPREKPIVLVCEHGLRSSFAGFMLNLSGYENVRELDGGMKAWKKNRLPLEY